MAGCGSNEDTVVEVEQEDDASVSGNRLESDLYFMYRKLIHTWCGTCLSRNSGFLGYNR